MEDKKQTTPNMDKAVENRKKFHEIVSKLEKDDTCISNGKVRIKRSGWRQIADAYGISWQILSIDVKEDPTVTHTLLDKNGLPKIIKGTIFALAKVKATSQSGRTVEEWDSCDTMEFAKSDIPPTYHNITTTATTRAINRAISDIVGVGDVSAEELEVCVVNGNGNGNGSKETPKPAVATEYLSPNQQAYLTKAITSEKAEYVKYWLEFWQVGISELTKQQAHDMITKMQSGAWKTEGGFKAWLIKKANAKT